MSRVFFNLKVCGKESHREAFLDGFLHMNPLGFFRKYEEGAVANIADRHEATVSLLQPGQFTMKITSELLPGGEYTIPAEDLAGPSVIQYDAHNTMNVLCLYAVHERGCTFESEDDFERFVEAQMLKPEVDGLGDYAAVVLDTAAFQQRVLQVIRTNGFRAVAGLVDYYDPSTFHGSFDNTQALLKKRSEFSHQREYRFAVDRDVHEEAPYTLSVGSLRDIAIGCRTSEVNELIRNYLHQMKAQGVFG
ncbi:MULTISPECIES: hypothetical protein [unclassified Pseudomonas]|uniref:hypothetical protein n=1 Tax=unclassified Pseudomonas TaxID=196821 RepID=UPI001607F75F|nr:MULTISPECIES: hypothetical protein [unclassified Pseudomonas]MBB6289785.1 hypothetical protein [Pseudomonas sp. SJZ073]MBB6314895.1 hypothetical protein [Pseudomonas sp. JAI120]